MWFNKRKKFIVSVCNWMLHTYIQINLPWMYKYWIRHKTFPFFEHRPHTIQYNLKGKKEERGNWGGEAPVPWDRTKEHTQQACREQETPGSDDFFAGDEPETMVGVWNCAVHWMSSVVLKEVWPTHFVQLCFPLGTAHRTVHVSKLSRSTTCCTSGAGLDSLWF